MKSTENNPFELPPLTNRIAALDSIRGLAALTVLLCHSLSIFAWPISFEWASFPMVNIFFNGTAAVTMFFVLSGFVLSKPYLQNGETPAKPFFFIPFFVRRITRIWIPWFFVFCVSLLLRCYFPIEFATQPEASDLAKGLWQRPLSGETIVRQILFAMPDVTHRLLPQDWSLGVELKGSALIPILLFFAHMGSAALLVFGFFLLFILDTGQYYTAFAFGVLAAQVFNRQQNQSVEKRFLSKATMLLAGSLLYQARLFDAHLAQWTRFSEKIIWTLNSAGCVMIIIACLESRRLRSALEHPTLKLFGRISYSVYLLQYIVLIYITPYAIFTLNQNGIRQVWLLLPVSILVNLLVTVLISYISFLLIEEPSIQFGRWLSKARISNKKSLSRTRGGGEASR